MGTNEIGVLAELGTLFSGGMRIMIPIGFAALGCTVSERVGIVNIGAEGMMLAGAFGGAVGSYVFGNAWMGLLCAILLGVLMASIHGLLTIKFKTGQIISGLGINMLAEGATAVLMQSIWGNRGKSPEVAALPNIRIDAVGDSSFFAPLLKSISPLLILLIRDSGPEIEIVSGSVVLLPISYSFAGLVSPTSTLIGNLALSTSSISMGMVAVCVWIFSDEIPAHAAVTGT